MRAAPYLVGAVAGYLADARFGDPRRGHPVALFGAAAGRLERRLWRDHRGAGALHAALAVGAVAGGAVLVGRAVRRSPLAGGRWRPGRCSPCSAGRR